MYTSVTYGHEATTTGPAPTSSVSMGRLLLLGRIQEGFPEETASELSFAG